MTSKLTCTYRATRSTPAWQDDANIQALWSAEVTKPLYSNPLPTPSSLPARSAAFAARCSWALIDSMAVVVVQLGVDVPTAAAALESSSAAWRRRLRCLCSLGRSHASGGAARQPSGGARHLRTRHWRTRAICSTLDFCRKLPTLMVCVNVTVYAPTKISVYINSLHVGVLQVCSARAARPSPQAAVPHGAWGRKPGGGFILRRVRRYERRVPDTGPPRRVRTP